MSKYPYKRVMVTGGAGFIGSCFIQQLALKNEGTEIVNLDNVKINHPNNKKIDKSLL